MKIAKKVNGVEIRAEKNWYVVSCACENIVTIYKLQIRSVSNKFSIWLCYFIFKISILKANEFRN